MYGVKSILTNPFFTLIKKLQYLKFLLTHIIKTYLERYHSRPYIRGLPYKKTTTLMAK